MNRRRLLRSGVAGHNVRRASMRRRCTLGLLAVCTAALWAQETRPTSNAVVIPIEGVIDDVLRRSIERRLDEARADGVDLVVFEMDTRSTFRS